MSFKTIFVIIISVVVTVILMNNTEEIDFWVFGEARFPKLAILGSMFGLGLIVGYLAGRPKTKVVAHPNENQELRNKNEPVVNEDRALSDEDRDYIR